METTSNNIIATTLQNKVQELEVILHTQREAILKASQEQIQKLLISIDPIFTGWDVQINEWSLTIKKIIDGYHREACEIKFTHTNDRETWKAIYHLDKTHLSWSSRSATEVYELQSGMMIGILCQLQFRKNFQWDELLKAFVAYHDTRHEWYQSDDVLKMRADITAMNKQIKDIETNENDSKFIEIFAKGELEFVKNVHYRTGAGKRNFINTDNFQWEVNKGGKTGKLTTTYYKGQPNEYKYTIKERMSMEDLKSFVLSYGFHKEVKG